MKFFATRRAAKWHREVTRVTKSWSRRPVTLHLGRVNTSLFPYVELQALTKAFLGREKSQEDTDARLLELIRNHGNEEIAFAACAHHLSIEAVRAFLQKEFEETFDKTWALDPYLCAFDAAVRCKPKDFNRVDYLFASRLVVVTADAKASPARKLTLLISAWKVGPPWDTTLLSRAVSLTATVMQTASLHLQQLQRTRSWKEARNYSAPLLELTNTVETAGSVFKDCVDAIFPLWRCWARWTPSPVALDAVMQRALLQYDKFACLQELEGPDVIEGDDFQETAWQGLVRRRQIILWLETKGFKIGVGLIVGDTESLWKDFVEHFRRVLNTAISDGGTSMRLLTTYIDREGLDNGTLTAWEDASRLLIKPLPKFVKYIVDPKADVKDEEDLDIVAGQALAALGHAAHHAIRKPILAEISQCVQLAHNKLETDLRVNMPLLALDFEWLSPALRLWRLRESLVTSTWLHSAVETRLLDAAQAQPSTHNLQVLRELHSEVNKAGDLGLKSAMATYVHEYVAEGTVRSDRTLLLPVAAKASTKHAPKPWSSNLVHSHGYVVDKAVTSIALQLPQALHELWTKAHDHSTREAGLTLAMLDTVRVDIRTSCIAELACATSTVAEQLQHRLSQVRVGIAAAYIDLTDVIMWLTDPLPMKICWAASLWAMLKVDDIFVDMVTFTNRGHKAYRRWIEHLHTLFGDTLNSVGEIHGWHQEMEEMVPVLDELEEMFGSKPVMHRLLTITTPETCMWHLKILRSIHTAKKKEHRTFMLTLLLSLNAQNARMLYTTIHAAVALNPHDFQCCRRFLTLARDNSDLAAARLDVQLNMSEVSPTLKATMTQVAEVLALKESEEAWIAAKKHYDEKVQELIEKARELEKRRMRFMRSQRLEVEKMMEDLKLEAPIGIAALLAELPAELADVVEDIAEDQLDMHFSLNGLHSLTKLALGVRGTETVVLSLRIDGSGVVDALCVHLEEASTEPRMTHVWTKTVARKAAPIRLLCNGRQTRLAQVISRAVWRECQSGAYDIAALYDRVKGVIQNGANECVVCADPIGARLHRATCCGNMLCTLTGNEADFAVRTEMVKHDQRVVDLLLTAVFAAATAKNQALLPEIPGSLSDTAKLLVLLNALPATEVLARVTDMHMSLRLVGKHADVLMSWVCNSSRTFIISATGHWRIPNMPGIHQFLVVDNPPQVESAFAKHNHLQPRMVLFHGTTMDRLYAILAQGLRVLSHTPLMKHGAASGAGIYFSSDTGLPASYAAGATKAVGNPKFFKTRKDFDGPQVLLGCEHAGPVTKGGIFVVADPSKVVVRYIFLVPRGVAYPAAKDIVAPMISTFYSLRSSAAVHR